MRALTSLGKLPESVFVLFDRKSGMAGDLVSNFKTGDRFCTFYDKTIKCRTNLEPGYKTMRLEDFTENSPGTLVQTVNGQHAFVPYNLPPELDYAKLLAPLTAAGKAIGELKGASRRLINPNILIRPLQRQEALTSSAMEGTYTTADKLLLADLSDKVAVDESTREVRNYLAALRLAQSMLKELPLSHRVLKAAHRQLLSGLSAERGSRKKPGEYRDDQNFIGSPTRKIEDARFVPPPSADAHHAMDALEQYLNRDCNDDAQRLIDMMLVHYQLETIHPFADGNGRLGRMLVTLMSMTSGLLDAPLLYLSPAIERDKDAYIDLMYAVSTKGEWTEWAIFFFSKVAEASERTVRLVDRLIALQAELRKLVSDNIRSAKALDLVDLLFDNPAIDITTAGERLGITYPAARNLVERFASLEIVEEFIGFYPRTFIAHRIVDAADE